MAYTCGMDVLVNTLEKSQEVVRTYSIILQKLHGLVALCQRDPIDSEKKALCKKLNSLIVLCKLQLRFLEKGMHDS